MKKKYDTPKINIIKFNVVENMLDASPETTLPKKEDTLGTQPNGDPPMEAPGFGWPAF